VLHVIANFHLGGSARLVVDLFERLSDRYAQSVVSNDLPAAPAYVGIPVEHHPQTTLDAAIGVLRRQRPAFVHVHYLGHHRDKYGALDWEWYRHWFAAAEKLDVRVIENVNIPTTPFISNAVAVYVHVSDYVRERFGQREGRHVTIYPGSDFSTFAPSPSTGMAADCLGMVYRLQRDKLDERAIEPFIEAVRLRPATRAVIVGDGPLLEPFRRRVREARMERAFTFTGSVAYDQLPALYRQMSVFVAPIHCESFGQVTPFAMGMGLPVIGYDVGALLEIVGDRSTLTPPGDSQRLGELAAALLDDPARRADLGAANRARAERLFSVESMIAGYEPLYAELARPAGGDDGTG
jgi:glycosyltransferase involved in cell wall biosynthesis